MPVKQISVLSEAAYFVVGLGGSIFFMSVSILRHGPSKPPHSAMVLGQGWPFTFYRLVNSVKML